MIFHSASLLATPLSFNASSTIWAAGVANTQQHGIPSPFQGFVKQAASPITKKLSVTNENGGLLYGVHPISSYWSVYSGSGIELSKDAVEELTVFLEKVNNLYEISFTAFDDRNTSILGQVKQIEEEIDEYCAELEQRHIDRVKQGNCTAQAGSVFLQTISNLERLADHIYNVARSIKSYKPVKENIA